MQELVKNPELRDDAGALSRDFVRSVKTALEADQKHDVLSQVQELHEADTADLIELLRPDERVKFIKIVGKDLDINILPELDEGVRDQVIDDLPNEQVADAVRALESDDAIYLLEDLKKSEQSDILAKIPKAEREMLQRSLDYPTDSAGRLMQVDVIAVPPFWSVGQTIDYMRETEDLPDTFSELYVVDPLYHPVGYVPLSRLLRSKRPVAISDITNDSLHMINVNEDQEEVARQFERYNLISTPVIDENKRLVGVITVDDIVEVIQEEAEEDIHRLGGVGNEALSDTVLKTANSRFSWLFVNLLTAVLASLVIGLFDATLQQMVALAVLMPIVASMGGNAATQTMTVAVRALATRDLGAANATRIIIREFLVSVLNGILFAIIIGAITYFWFFNGQLGMVIGIAMIFNMLAAGMAGILIPLALNWWKIDPAIASSVFVTTVTDIVGFFAFLGLAAIWLI
ncbi:MAG: magnesium transporter [Pseudomonadota bacterium]